MATTEKLPSVHRVTCGSYAGYKAHRKHNEIVCDDCKAARNQWEKDRRAARATAANRAALTTDERARVSAYMERGINNALMVEFIENLITDRLLRYT